MVRLSSPISSRLLLAGSYAAIGGIALYGTFYLLFHEGYEINETSYPIHGELDLLELAIETLTIAGPFFGFLICCIPFFPFTLIYASLVCPSRITITNTEIHAKFGWKECIYSLTELDDITFQRANEREFIILKVGKKKLKAELDLGAYRNIRDLIPVELAAKVAARS